jgi:hypothetical protein
MARNTDTTVPPRHDHDEVAVVLLERMEYMQS